ncbi:apoptosis-inducing factor 3 isoform X2 [Rhynchophorus ferrugineus]|uniref:apoptosis-inducing factor 3 isoform X2 n=1 Tax=Rhynchophorus ferrugineus TaxID=354439 RepID=UPI003FCC949C
MGCNSSKLEIAKSSVNIQNEPEDFVEGVVCKINDINENEMKTVELDEKKILLVKQNGKISALGTKCTHYGAPLVNGALGDGRIRCQWHGACFSLATGDIEDFPGLDSLPCYKVTIDNDNVKVRARKSELVSNKRIKHMAQKLSSESKKIVIIGGGPAGATCVEALRQEGFQGGITMVCRERYLPYDRVKVSKAMDFEIEKAQLRDDKFYKEHNIDILKGIEATGVDTGTKTVSLSNGNHIQYDKLFIATGCKPRKLDVPGCNLKNVLVLRDYDDSQYAISQINDQADVVVIGSSFIGMEAANYCVDKVKSVTVIGRDSAPFKSIWGEQIGVAILKLFESKGVKFIPHSGIKKINDNGEGAISSVELKDGQILKADILFMGTGSTYYTDFLKGSGVELRPDGTIETNEYLQTNDPNVYVGGDIAYSPVWSHHNNKVAIGHYPLAHYHGKMAALNILGKQTPIKSVPYFWTMLFGKGFRYAGHGKYDDIIFAGDVDSLKFMAFFLKDDEVVSTASCGMDPLVSQFAERLAQGRKLYRKDIQDDPLAWSKTV